jgi:hypothetical protein
LTHVNVRFALYRLPAERSLWAGIAELLAAGSPKGDKRISGQMEHVIAPYIAL